MPSSLATKLKDQILEKSSIYNLYSSLVGRTKAERTFTEQFIKPEKHDKILDLGCGTGAMLNHMEAAYYEGFDINADYIDQAKTEFKQKGTFIHSSLADYQIKPEYFDKAVSCGVLHHLDDTTALKLLSIASASLKPGSSLFTLDGCFTENQNFIDHLLQKNDRGKFVRTENELLSLAKQVFNNVNAHVIKGLFRIPFTVIIVEYKK